MNNFTQWSIKKLFYKWYLVITVLEFFLIENVELFLAKLFEIC